MLFISSVKTSSRTNEMLRTTENLCPNVVRRRRQRERPFAIIASATGETKPITLADIDDAANRASSFLRANVEAQCFVYIGSSDIRYLIWVLAAMKTQKCVVFASPGNTPVAQKRFFNTVGADTLLFAPEVQGMLSHLLENTSDMKHIATPSYGGLFSGPVEEVPFEPTYEQLQDVPFMVLHTSGTSGHPKPIYWTHKAASVLPVSIDPAIQEAYGEHTNLMLELVQGQNVLLPFPLFHLGGLGGLITAIHYDTTIVLPTPGTPLSPQNFTALLEAASCTSACAPPSVLEGMLDYPPGLEALSKLHHVAYTGGPLHPQRGQRLSEHISHLFPIFASTEGGPVHLASSTDKSRWNAFKFIPLGQRMEAVGDDLYELVFPRTELLDQTYAFSVTCPDTQAYRTKDLFSPLDDGWWVFRGRADNWVVMSNGLKMDPTGTENKISAHPAVSAAIVAGSHRFRLCLLVETKGPVDLEDIWATVQEANKAAPKFGRIPKELILFAHSDKPFLRTGKGTIQRRLSIELYDREIEVLYNNAEEGLLVSDLPPMTSTSQSDIQTFLVELYSDTLESSVSPDEDLFQRGLDSLATFVVAARLKAALRVINVPSSLVDKINARMLYNFRTPHQLSLHLASLLAGDSGYSSPSTVSADTLLQRYQAQLQSLLQTKETVVLTGSTGSLGSHLLASLLRRGHSVICLDRYPARDKVTALFTARGIDPVVLDHVQFLQTDLTKDKLGLSEDAYDFLLKEATIIIHNAFPVNFLLSVEAFEPQIQSFVNLLDLGCKAKHDPRVLFISSVAAAASKPEIPETYLSSDPDNNQGYGHAKYICEKLLEQYVSSSRRGAVLRIGQVCGPLSEGTWNSKEWLPSLIASSKMIGAIPDSIGNDSINWIPVDVLSNIIIDMIRVDSGVYNIVHPRPSAWQDLIPDGLQRIPAETWIEMIERAGDTVADLHKNPALKLIDFYRGAFSNSEKVHVDIQRTLSTSQAARGVAVITRQDMDRWAKAW